MGKKNEKNFANYFILDYDRFNYALMCNYDYICFFA